ICMTSNAGSTDKSVGVGFNRTENEISKDKAMKGLREFLRPEFISRIDEIVVFSQLTKENFASIAALMIDEMKEPLAEKKLDITYDQKALDLIAEKSYGKPYGARDIRRVIRQDVEDKVAELIINHVSDISCIDITAEGDEIKVTGVKKESSEE
ncbi:MAG: ATP-dependent Clp protease ATP-binding subunit, partial [Ruminococcus sp.]|nr:ATP-dependent Clp protease ATP-binding subunit [Ruminococcus sp.]